LGRIPMECPRCGTTNINEMLVRYSYKLPNGEKAGDTTTLPKFLYYLEHPKDLRGTSQQRPPNIVLPILGIFCDKCIGKGEEDGWQRIKTTRYGV